MYYVTKLYGHELGLSACFRQWKATSHCRFLHGYPLSFKLVFACTDSDLLNDWVLDFGGLKEVKQWLCDTFDHKMLIAHDDPALQRLMALGSEWIDMSGGRLSQIQLAQPLIVPAVGCEGFAKFVSDYVFDWLGDRDHAPRVWLHAVEVREHGGNSAIYQNEIG